MPELAVVGVTPEPDETGSHITQIGTAEVGGRTFIVGTTRLDGIIQLWELDQGTLIERSAIAYNRPWYQSFSNADLAFDGNTLAVLGETSGDVELYTISASGNLTPAQSLSLSSDPNAFAILGDFGVFSGDGSLISVDLTSGAQISNITTPVATDLIVTTVNDAQIVLTLDDQSHSITSWNLSNGILTQADTLGAADGLAINAPNTVKTAIIDGTTYAIVGSSGSGSLTVLGVAPNGALSQTDHLLDTLDTRFSGVTTIDVFEKDGITYVAAGGSDDGITLFSLIPGGRLVTLASFEDTTELSLADPSAITITNAADGLFLHIASASEYGITTLHYATGGGAKIQANPGGFTFGTSGTDLIRGSDTTDTIFGGSGDDLLIDGAGIDTLYGGAGADTFVLNFDGVTDHIQDFELGKDRIDLSAWPMLMTMGQLFVEETAVGIRLRYGTTEILEITTDTNAPLDPAALTDSLLMSGRYLFEPLPGFAGPVGDPMTAPTITDYYEPPADLVIPDPDHIQGTVAADILWGTTGANTITGSSGNDTISGGDGDDLLFGNIGDDTLLGENGNDRLLGGKGSDTLLGGAGNDWLRGRGGNDHMFGGAGEDTLLGGLGDDELAGDDGADALFGRQGNDTLDGGSGSDVLRGGKGSDHLSGGTGNDELRGNGGNDLLYGEAGNDKLWGGSGNDTLNGGGGNDWLKGGEGRDTFIFFSGTDTIRDFDPSVDILYLHGSISSAKTAEAVIARHASVQNDGVHLDFGSNELILNHLKSVDGLESVITLY